MSNEKINLNDFFHLNGSFLAFVGKFNFEMVAEIVPVLPDFYQKLEANKLKELVFDFAQVAEMDTAGFTLVINMLHDCSKKYQCRIENEGNIHTYGELYDLEDFLCKFSTNSNCAQQA